MGKCLSLNKEKYNEIQFKPFYLSKNDDSKISSNDKVYYIGDT